MDESIQTTNVSRVMKRVFAVSDSAFFLGENDMVRTTPPKKTTSPAIHEVKDVDEGSSMVLVNRLADVRKTVHLETNPLAAKVEAAQRKSKSTGQSSGNGTPPRSPGRVSRENSDPSSEPTGAGAIPSLNETTRFQPAQDKQVSRKNSDPRDKASTSHKPENIPNIPNIPIYGRHVSSQGPIPHPGLLPQVMTVERLSSMPEMNIQGIAVRPPTHKMVTNPNKEKSKDGNKSKEISKENQGGYSADGNEMSASVSDPSCRRNSDSHQEKTRSFSPEVSEKLRQISLSLDAIQPLAAANSSNNPESGSNSLESSQSIRSISNPSQPPVPCAHTAIADVSAKSRSSTSGTGSKKDSGRVTVSKLTTDNSGTSRDDEMSEVERELEENGMAAARKSLLIERPIAAAAGIGAALNQSMKYNSEPSFAARSLTSGVNKPAKSPRYNRNQSTDRSPLIAGLGALFGKKDDPLRRNTKANRTRQSSEARVNHWEKVVQDEPEPCSNMFDEPLALRVSLRTSVAEFLDEKNGPLKAQALQKRKQGQRNALDDVEVEALKLFQENESKRLDFEQEIEIIPLPEGAGSTKIDFEHACIPAPITAKRESQRLMIQKLQLQNKPLEDYDEEFLHIPQVKASSASTSRRESQRFPPQQTKGDSSQTDPFAVRRASRRLETQKAQLDETDRAILESFAAYLDE